MRQLPAYIQEQYRSRYGRNGRGRLWIDDSMFSRRIQVASWPQTPLGYVLGETIMGQSYAGIVVKNDDVKLLRDMPGVVTDMKIQRK